VCLSVEKEVDKVLSKFQDINSKAEVSLEDLVQRITDIKQELAENSAAGSEINTAQALIITQCLNRVKDSLAELSSNHRDMHGSVSKVGKAIDRNFVSDFSSVVTEGAFDGDDQTAQINNVICEHFLRQGMLEIAESLIEDSQMGIQSQQKEPFLELHRILEALKSRDLQPALNWAQANCDSLCAAGSSLEFKLKRLQFIGLVEQGYDCQAEALIYARNFERFAYSHIKEVQTLMGSMLFMKTGIANSPYKHLLDAIHWVDICDVFTRDACALLGLSVESPLQVVVRAGCLALPPLLNIKQVMQAKQCSGVWSSKDELPVEIDVGAECRYHSIFACPILRQQSNERNPPIRLVCGHVISRDALNKLSNGNKVKCPYCPVEQSPGDVREIHF